MQSAQMASFELLQWLSSNGVVRREMKESAFPRTKYCCFGQTNIAVASVAALGRLKKEEIHLSTHVDLQL